MLILLLIRCQNKEIAIFLHRSGVYSRPFGHRLYLPLGSHSRYFNNKPVNPFQTRRRCQRANVTKLIRIVMNNAPGSIIKSECLVADVFLASVWRNHKEISFQLSSQRTRQSNPRHHQFSCAQDALPWENGYRLPLVCWGYESEPEITLRSDHG